MKLTLRNADLKAAHDAMETLCTGTNRLPTLAALRADRTLRRLREAWAPIATIHQTLVKDNGEEKDGMLRVTDANMPTFLTAWSEALSVETEVEVDTLTVADIEAGWSREDGKKGPLDISPADLGNLIVLGIIVEPKAQEAA